MAPVPPDTSRVSSEKDNEKDASSFGLGVEELGGGEFICNQRRSAREWIDDTRLAMRTQMSMKRFHMTIISLVGFDLLVVMAELIVALLTAGCSTELLYDLLKELLEHNHDHVDLGDFACSVVPSASRDLLENSLFGLNLGLLCIFQIEVISSIIAFGPVAYCKSWVSLLDGSVVLVTLILDIYFHFSDSPSAKSPIALVVLRLWKVFRAVHAIAHALELHYEKVMEQTEKGHRAIVLERRAEGSRLEYYRAALEATGHDVDPAQVEIFVAEDMVHIQEDEEEAELAALGRSERRARGLGNVTVRRIPHHVHRENIEDYEN